MYEIQQTSGELLPGDQEIVSSGFKRHSSELNAPDYKKERINWLAYDDSRSLVGALTADLLWDWLYIDELWTAENQRGRGLGRHLMEQAEEYALSNKMTGLWLWTQSWQAADFYNHLNYEEFARFNNFPKGYCRIGFRKYLLSTDNK